MSEKAIPRVMIAGTGSGCGKTTITCGILAALKKRGLSLAACKCGPDYIDPMFHQQINQIPSTNLDLCFAKEDTVRYLLMKNAGNADVTVIEGVMGFYDGMGMDTVKASSYDVARVTDTPVILLINAKGMALSVLPIIQGFLEFQKDHTIKGIILNGVSSMTGKLLQKQIEAAYPVKVYGTIPYLEAFHLESRHLGLITPYEIADIQKEIDRIGEIVEKYVDLDGLLALAKETNPLSVEPPAIVKTLQQEQKGAIEKIKNASLRIGVAFDPAFCFYYKDNLEFLKELGCTLVNFSPLKDARIPENLDILLLGGGYPEIYARELSANESMRKSILHAIEEGMPCMAECGGFMYLHEQMEDENGQWYPMVGVIQGKTWKKDKLVRFGYASLTARQENKFLKDGETIQAHEFHYWDSDNNGSYFLATKPSGKKSWECMHVTENLIAGYPHLYFYSNLAVPVRFLLQCVEKKKRE